MPYPNEFSCRLEDPSKFKDPWARVKRKSKSMGKTYSVVRGTSKATGEFEDQAFRYPKKTWKASEAKSHCKSHKGSYEAAADIQKVDALIEASSQKVEKESSTAEGALLTRFAARIINTPLMITQEKLNVILNVLGGRIGLEVEDTVIDLEAAARSKSARRVSGETCVAVIQVYDTLVYRSRGLMALSGLSTYEQIGKDFKEALEDRDVDAILLDIDSPGGEVSGVFELADTIYNARGTKPVTASVNDMACSAAFLIASAADKIYVPRMGVIGSIGVIAVHTDQSEYDKQRGMKYTAVIAGAKKNDLSPHEEISSEAVGDVQAKVDIAYKLFVDTVARNRDISPEDVCCTEAATYLGEDGMKAGLADGVLAWDQVLETFTTNTLGGATMPPKDKNLKENLDELLKGVSTEDQNEVFALLGYTPAENVTVLVEAKTKTLQLEVDALKKEKDTYRAEVRKELEKSVTAGDETIKLQERITQLEKTVADATKKAETAEDGRRTLEIQTELKEIGVVGDLAKRAKSIFMLEKMHPEMAKEQMEQLRQDTEALKAAGIFSEIGSGTDAGSGPSAYDKLKAIVDKLKEDPKVSDAEAWQQAARQNSALYKQYSDEHKTEGE